MPKLYLGCQVLRNLACRSVNNKAGWACAISFAVELLLSHAVGHEGHQEWNWLSARQT